MGGIPYADQSASGLRFHLMIGQIDVEPYTVLQRHRFVWADRPVELGILGASHFLRVTTPAGQLNEIFACAEITTDLPQIQAGPLGTLPTVVSTRFANLRYSFEPRLMAWEDGEDELKALLAQVEAAQAEPAQVGLSFEFPGKTREDRPPLTVVWGRATTTSLVVKTVHAYPNEGRLVFTETNMEEVR